MPQWFRFYNEALDDPKVQTLKPRTFRSWIGVLCLTARRNGERLSLTEISFGLRLSEAKTLTLIDELTLSGLINVNEIGILPHNWNGRQFKNDVSTERVKRFRQRRETVSETSSETPPDSDSDTDTETESKKGFVNAARPPVPVEAPSVATVKNQKAHGGEKLAVDAWNDLAGRIGLPAVQRLTTARAAALRARLIEVGGIDGWLAALAKIEASPFLRGEGGHGQGHEGWRCNFDWLISQRGFTRLLEGAFDSTPGAGRGSLSRAMRDLVDETEGSAQ
jgi:hypothetical protein